MKPLKLKWTGQLPVLTILGCFLVPHLGGVEATTATCPGDLVTLRVVLKSKRKPGSGKKAKKARARALEPTVWDGGLSLSDGKVNSIRFWQDDPRNSIEGSSWTLTTRRRIPQGSAERKRGYENMPVRDAALVIELAGVNPQTRLSFETRQGNFGFALREVRHGTKRTYLSRLVEVNRMATSRRILTAPTEDDFPSAILADGKLHVAYVAFTHGPDFRKRPPLAEAPEDLGFLEQPAGGDQVLLLRLDGDRWAGPLAVTPPGQDVYRTALAADGSGRVWVFWSANRDGNWDLFARSLKGDRWSEEIRLTSDGGHDIFPAAVADSSGRVWVAWQAFRGSNSNILALRQEEGGFGKPLVVSDHAASEWTPAVAASRKGEVAIAWDTYAGGSYDVYCRIWAGGELQAPFPVTASPRAEMRPSIAYDGGDRLWLAYEDSPVKWGKDWGALEKEGVPLYRGRSIAVRIWSMGKLWRPADDPVPVLQPGVRGEQGRNQLRLALPRLAADSRGRVWLGVRSPRLGTRVAVGTAWFEHLTWYDGEKWSGEIICPGTDNILDNRPALVPFPEGEMALVGSTDGRFATANRLPQWLIRQLRKKGEKIRQPKQTSPWPDPVNNELVMARTGPVPPGGAETVKLEPVPPVQTAALSPEARREAADVARAREMRLTLKGKNLRLWRGEFHRHTELSQDGGGDGLLLDMWRYAIDAASLDWIGNGDHDNGSGREYSWWIIQKTADIFNFPGVFTPMHCYERSCSYPDGHRNVVFARRGIRTLPRLQGGRGKDLDNLPEDARRPHTPDTQLLYRYLARFDGVCASHTSGTDMGTDWRDSNPKVEPIVEIYQGCRQSYEMPGAPRSNTEKNSIGGWRPFGFVSLALKKGHRLGFQASSDHVSTHISYCNVWVESPDREGILAAMKARRVYGSTDNIIADVRCGDHFMGEEFTLRERPRLSIHLVGTRPFARVHIIKDGNYVHSAEPKTEEVQLEWTDFDARPGTTSYYYVRGEQEDGELVWVSPLWITYAPGGRKQY